MNRDVCEHFVPTDLPCEKCTEKRKSEALFLADELTIPLGTVIGSEVYRRAAAELRRLQAQRDALLEALKWCIRQMPEPVLPGTYTDGYKVARAAIANAEEKA